MSGPRAGRRGHGFRLINTGRGGAGASPASPDVRLISRGEHNDGVNTARPPSPHDRPRAPRNGSRARMTGKQRREQLLDIGRKLFAERGFEGTSVEEIAATAGVSKPVVYEHFGGKEGLYAVVVDREIQALLAAMTATLTTQARSREVLEQAALQLLGYIESSTDGFRILVRDSPVTGTSGGFASLISDVASQV